MKGFRKVKCWLRGGHDRIVVPHHAGCGYCRRCGIDLCRPLTTSYPTGPKR